MKSKNHRFEAVGTLGNTSWEIWRDGGKFGDFQSQPCMRCGKEFYHINIKDYNVTYLTDLPGVCDVCINEMRAH